MLAGFKHWQCQLGRSASRAGTARSFWALLRALERSIKLRSARAQCPGCKNRRGRACTRSTYAQVVDRRRATARDTPRASSL